MYIYIYITERALIQGLMIPRSPVQAAAFALPAFLRKRLQVRRSVGLEDWLRVYVGSALKGL